MKNRYFIIFLYLLLIITLDSIALTYSKDDVDDICVKDGNDTLTHYSIVNQGSSVDNKKITIENIEGKTINFGSSNQFKLNVPGDCYIDSNDYTFNPDDLTAGVGKYLDIVEKEANKYIATCKKEYSFTSSIADNKCVKNSDGSFYTCPDEANSIQIGNVDFYSVEYNYNSKNWEYKIKINKDGKNVTENYRIELVQYKYSNNNIDINGKKYSGYGELSDSLVLAKQEGKYVGSHKAKNNVLTLNITPGNKYKLFFVVEKGGCSDTVVFTYDVYGSTEIPNRWKNNSYCTNFVNSTTNYSIETLNVAKVMVSPCFNEKVSTLDDVFQKSDGEIQRYIEGLISNFKLNATNNSNNTINNNPSAYQCYFENDGSSNNNINLDNYNNTLYQGAYWGISCNETLNIKYDSPVKTNYNGGGFEYNATVTTNRTCNLYEIDYPKYKERCSFGVMCYGGVAGDYDPVTGLSYEIDSTGPNEDFDNCVLNCDGGKYTQSCINSCYNKVYVNNNTSNLASVLDKISLLPLYQNFNSKIAATRLTYARTGSDGSKYTHDGHLIIETLPSDCSRSWLSTSIGTWCKNTAGGGNRDTFGSCSDLGPNWVSNGNTIHVCSGYYEGSYIRYRQSNYCVRLGAECFLIQNSGSNCVADPEADYQNQLTAYYNEYNTFIGYLNGLESYSNEESFKIQIDEADETISNSKKKDKIEYKTTTFGSGNLDYDHEMKVTRTTSKSGVVSNGGYSHVGNLSLKTASSNKTIYLSISKDTYKNKVLNEFNYVNKGKSGNEYKDSKTYKNAVLKNGYYLQMNSMEVNDASSWPTSISDNKKVADYNKNIKLNFYNLGTWKQWGHVENITNNDKGIEVDCFYGTLSPKMGGNDFIFRVIKLNDVFPNRDPRFNWSDDEDASLDKGTLYEYEKVNPVALVDNIQAKSNSVYDDPSEVDYEFTLTQKQLRAIKNYNKDEKRSGRVYTDYLTERSSFECSQSGCLSRFVSDATYVTWVGGNRASISKCNNAKEYGSKCDDIGS